MLAGNFRTAPLSTYASVVAPGAALSARPTHAAAAARSPAGRSSGRPPVRRSPHRSASTAVSCDSPCPARVWAVESGPHCIETVAADLTKDLTFTGRQDRAVTAPNEHWGHTPPA